MRKLLQPMLSGIGALTRVWRSAIVPTITIALTPVLLFAQSGTVTGVVVGTGGQPVASATILVTGGTQRATTDSVGRFTLVGLSGDQISIEVRRLGYRVDRRQVTVGGPSVQIALVEQSIALDAVVVTGTAGAQARREIGNAITRVDASAATELGTVSSVQQLLNARAPGVFVNPSSGVVGGGSRIRIRGASSLSLTNEPLVYVDGIRVNSAAATGPVNQGFATVSGQSGGISRINDINPDDIESIEVIKGPAAATLYGTEASGGVIQIITKKGTTGRSRWNFNTRVGTNYIRNVEDIFPTNYASIPRPGGPAGTRDTISRNIIDTERALGRELFRTGRVGEYDLATSGGSDLFRYYAGGGYENTTGVDPANGVKRKTGRLNLSLTPSNTLNFGFNVSYMNGYVTLPCEAGCGGITLTSYLANPANDTTLTSGVANPFRGFNSGLPEAYSAYYEFYQNVDRFTGGFSANQQVTSWLSHRATIGMDRTREENSELGRRIADTLFQRSLGISGLGYRDMTWRAINGFSGDYSASATHDLTTKLRSTTTFGTQYFRNYYELICARGEQFPALGITTVSATTTNRSTCQDEEEDATLGLYLQQQMGISNRLFLVGAIRADDNSAFGRNFDRVFYPKLSASWVVSEESFFADMPLLDQLKLRAAYGESGKQPITFSALQTYTSATGPGNAPTVTPLSIGNPDLGPERSKELEMGFDVGAWRDRVSAEFTWYSKRTQDAILDRQIAGSIGIPGSQPFNAGSVKNWGTEIMLRLRPVDMEKVQWETGLSLATNDSEVENLGTAEAVLQLRRDVACGAGSTAAACPVDDFVLASSGAFAPRHQVGYPVGSYFNKRITSAAFNTGAGTINTATLMCDNGKGGEVLCSAAPLVYLGRTIPTRELNFSNSFTFFTNFRAFALMDFKGGHVRVNGSDRFRCVVQNRCRERWYPTEFDPKRIACVTAGTDALPDCYVNKADFGKLREVSLSYTLPPSVARLGRVGRATVTLAGRNLHTWTDYPGIDPEASFLGGSRGGNFSVFDQLITPTPAQWILGLNIDW
jgi:TonB-linked SusC/RagA family outer membrane protein